MAQSDEQSRPDVPLPPAVTGEFPPLVLAATCVTRSQCVSWMGLKLWSGVCVGGRLGPNQTHPPPLPGQFPGLGPSHPQDRPSGCPSG